MPNPIPLSTIIGVGWVIGGGAGIVACGGLNDVVVFIGGGVLVLAGLTRSLLGCAAALVFVIALATLDPAPPTPLQSLEGESSARAQSLRT